MAERIPADDDVAARAVLDALPDLRFRLTRDGTYLSCHAPPGRLVAPRETVIGRRMRDLLPSELAAHAERELATAIDEQRVTSAEYALPINGEERWHETRFVPLGNEAVAIVRDVTDRVRAEREARAHLQLAESALRAITDAVIVVDTDGAVLRVNDVFERMLGYPADEVRGIRAPFPWWPEEEREAVGARVRTALTGSTTTYEGTFKRRDGRRFPVLVTGAPMLEPDGRQSGVVATVRDLTAQRRAEEQLGEAQRWIDGIVTALDEHLYAGRIDPDGTYHELYCGRNIERLIGRPLAPGENTATAWEASIHPDDRDVYLTACNELRTLRRVDIEYRMVGADGQVRWLHDRTWARPQAPGDDGVIVDGIVTDVTQRRRTADELLTTLAELHQTAADLEQARAEADRLARTDSLTGCFNRRHARELLDVELDRAHGTGTRVGLLVMDVDHFKAVNDTHGHHTGDAVLLAVATTLRAAVRAGDCVARWGGEEFVVVLPGVEREDTLTTLAEELREAIAATSVRGRERLPVSVTVSIGAVVSSPSFPSIERLVDAADQALYEAKRAGRNRVVCHPGLDEARAA